MKKKVAIGIIISAISLNYCVNIFAKSVIISIHNQSDMDDVRVEGADGGDIVVDKNKTESCEFKLREQDDSTYKTTLMVSPVSSLDAANDSMSRTTNVEVTGQGKEGKKNLVIKRGLECVLDGKSFGQSKRKHRSEDQDRRQDRNRKNKKSKRHIKQVKQDEGQE